MSRNTAGSGGSERRTDRRLEGEHVSLGLPSHLARTANSRALATGARWAGLVCLGVAVVNVGASSAGSPSAFTWLTLVALAPMVGLLIALAQGRTTALTIAYLAVGTVCTYFYVLTLFAATPAYRDSNLLVVALPAVAMTLVGGAGTGALVGVLWATLGFALAEAAVVLACSAAQRMYVPDAISLGAYLLLVAVLTYDGLTRNTRRFTQSALHRAVRESRLVDLRIEQMARATADVHDTVLSDLMAVAASAPGPLPAGLRVRIERDLRSLGPTDTEAADPGVSSSEGGELQDSDELSRAIEAARDDGLSVDVSGDRTVLTVLAPETRHAVGQAVRQCLVNVLRHSGSASAEVTLSAADGSVSVMVVDEGVGFQPSATPPDRLGLRESISDRISRVGGSVTVFSSEGVGTTVIMVLPVNDEAAEGAAGVEGADR